MHFAGDDLRFTIGQSILLRGIKDTNLPGTLPSIAGS